MKAFALLSESKFLQKFHGWATVVWFVLSLPLALAFGDIIVFVTFLSLYAIVTGHWSSWQAARVENLQIVEQKRHEEEDIPKGVAEHLVDKTTIEPLDNDTV